MTFNRDTFKRSISVWAQAKNREAEMLSDRLGQRAADVLASHRKRYRNSNEPRRFLREKPQASEWDKQDHEALMLQVAWHQAGVPKPLVKAMRELILTQHREEAPGRTWERPEPVDASKPPLVPQGLRIVSQENASGVAAMLEAARSPRDAAGRMAVLEALTAPPAEEDGGDCGCEPDCEGPDGD